MEGEWFNYKIGADGNRKMQIDTLATETRDAEVIRRKDLPEICTAEMKRIIGEYWITQKYGLPHGDGWAKNPCIAMDIIGQLDYENALIQSRKQDG